MKHYLYLHAQSARSALLKILRQPFGNLLNLLLMPLMLITDFARNGSRQKLKLC